jgi:integrase
MIYYTCIRPKELRLTQLKYIDFDNERIIIPASVSKNKKALPVKIDKALLEELTKLGISNYPSDYFLFGDTKNIIAMRQIGENTPYKRFNKCLTALGLLNKNYTLYSFKHLSNVRKYIAGWSIAEICLANRHSSLVETETYLKDLIKFIPNERSIPVI